MSTPFLDSFIRMPHSPPAKGKSPDTFPPWISKETQTIFERALQVKGGDHEMFSKLKNAYYHSEVLEFTNWIQIDEKELNVWYALWPGLRS